MALLWEQDIKMPAFDELSGHHETDVLIIGGGMVGVLCAHFLQQAGVNYMLLEAGEVGQGITKGTTAKITLQHGLCYDTLLRRFGKRLSAQYLNGNLWALEDYKRLCSSIDCDFEEQSSYVYKKEGERGLKKEVLALRQLGFPATLVADTPLPFPTVGAVCCPHQAQFHPLRFLSHISRPLNVYTHTKVEQLLDKIALTKKGTVYAKKIIVATHFPFLNKHGLYPLKMYQQRSYVLALENAPSCEGMYVDGAKNGLSFRHYKELLLLGGGGHRTGEQGGGWQELRRFAKRYFPHARERYHWATQDCMTLDGVPYIGRYGENTKGLYVATGFHKWGMTTSMLAGKILADTVTGKRNPYAEVFSPQRSMLRPQLAVNAAKAIGNYLSPTKKRCPHLGCALKWNKEEHTWDCPCHGSRFTKDGTLLDNPATDDLEP